MGEGILKDGGNRSLKNANTFFPDYTRHRSLFLHRPSVSLADPNLRRTLITFLSYLTTSSRSVNIVLSCVYRREHEVIVDHLRWSRIALPQATVTTTVNLLAPEFHI
jgi:hypothetical protein